MTDDRHASIALLVVVHEARLDALVVRVLGLRRAVHLPNQRRRRARGDRRGGKRSGEKEKLHRHQIASRSGGEDKPSSLDIIFVGPSSVMLSTCNMQ